MKTVIYNSPYLGAPGAIRWIVASWAEGFRLRGYDFYACDTQDQLIDRCKKNPPSILYCDIVSTPIEDIRFREWLFSLRQHGTKVCMNLYWPMNDQPLERVNALKNFDIADVYCGERESDSMRTFELDTGKTYITMPQSANPRFHYPVASDQKFAYDIVFVGAKLPNKRWFNEKILGELRKRYRVGLFGPGWTHQDNILRAISKGSRLVGANYMARLSDRFRFSVSEEDEPKLYASSKISLNFHERESDNTQPHHIVNQRTFKIAASGGFQIVDPVIALPKYFSSEEIVTANFDEFDWLDKVDYYIAHESERKAIQERATARAQSEHMAHHRVAMLEGLLAKTANLQSYLLKSP